MTDHITIPRVPHTITAEQTLSELGSSLHGLSNTDAVQRKAVFGANELPQAKPTGITTIFLRQFKSPLIYVLVIAAVLSIVVQEWSDASFIFIVLLLNAVIGAVQEHSAERASLALKNLVAKRCRVIRDGDSYELDASELVPGDILLLESGDKIPADVRLITQRDLKIDESLLTGESVSVAKNADIELGEINVIAERINMAFTGTLVDKGRATGVVVNTGLSTELGNIAKDVISESPVKAPLVLRMERFTHRIAIIVISAVIIFGLIGYQQGMPLSEIFLLSVALAVSAIPEGLPVALTVALAVGMHRMSKRNVIVRKLVAVESLGSCTFIATDKTGTLTVNQLTVKTIQFPDSCAWHVSGQGFTPSGTVQTDVGAPTTAQESMLHNLYLAAVLPNEGFLGHQDDNWVHHGDAVDVALLVVARKASLAKSELLGSYPELDAIPFEPENLYAASLNQIENEIHAYVKGAVEKLLPMCSHMMSHEGMVTINRELILQQATELANEGYRVLAFASGECNLEKPASFTEEMLHDLTFIGLVGMIDPLRIEAKGAITDCHNAGVTVAMVTGDNPVTALSIAKELDLAKDSKSVVTGPQLKSLANQQSRDEMVCNARVFARVEPHQKLQIVESLQRRNHFVAVSGDGANDAPALKAAHVGVAMGKEGTDIARESADIVLTDDNFASISAGIEEGRVAYANVRKVIFLLISTGAAEIVLFTLALLAGLPLPLLAVQLLWLNLVTNGIQDIALAFEPAEGDELSKPPRAPKEPIFNRLMIERVIVAALVMGSVAFSLFYYLINNGFTVEEARNGTLLLMVLFENIHVFNSRSESRSVFAHNPLRNRLLLFGTITAQLIHIGAMYTPWLRDVLGVQPVSLENWFKLLMLALTILLFMEIHKFIFKSRYFRTK